jgi:hypothetical protein
MAISLVPSTRMHTPRVHQVFTFKAAATIFSSSAVANGIVFFASVDGTVY